MSIYKVRIFGDPILREKMPKVKAVDSEIKTLSGKMIDVMKESEGVGLAANQIGILKSIIVVTIENKDIVFVNPKIIWKSEEVQTNEEGCLSLPNVYATVTRAEKIKISAVNLKEKNIELELEGILARIFQHEIDHIEGRLLIDCLKKEERKEALSNLNNYLLSVDAANK